MADTFLPRILRLRVVRSFASGTTVAVTGYGVHDMSNRAEYGDEDDRSVPRTGIRGLEDVRRRVVPYCRICFLFVVCRECPESTARLIIGDAHRLSHTN